MRLAPLLTLPNLLSLSRFPLAAGFLAADSTGVRLALLGAASVSDFLDGWFARHLRSTTKWGALLDPIADKVFVLAAVTTFILRGELSARDYFIILSRDFATAIGFLVAWWRPDLDASQFKARMSGKVVTVLQLLALVSLTVAPGWMRWLLPAIGVTSIVSIVDYTLALDRSRRA